MIQCFVKRNRQSSFAEGTEPRLISASNIHLDYAHHTRVLHKHEDLFELLFVRSGSTTYIIENQEYAIKRGDIVICNSGVLHDELIQENDMICSYSLAIDRLQIDGLPQNHLIAEESNPIVNTSDYYETFNGTLRLIFDLLAANQDGVEEACHYMMMSVLTLLLQLMQENESPQTMVQNDESPFAMRIRKYIDDHYAEDMNLQSIGNTFNINTYYLSHIFKKEMGYSPMQYILRRRIGEAQTLLITTKRSVTDISSAVGFNNPNNFDIQFTKNVGLSPRNYRKTYT